MNRILGIVGSIVVNVLLLGSVELSVHAAQEAPAGEVMITQLGVDTQSELLAQLEGAEGVRL